MTENEIVNMLEVEKAYMDSHGGRSQSEALVYAIESVKEIQQYRAIGTVEDYWKLNEMCKEYSAIGTIDEFKALKEKNEPKKLMHNGANWYRCPNGCEVHKKTFEKDWYCPKCGVKLDWNE